ncbi:helix-turn-helix domain-containing protein [Solirubrobacter phytolaccae]|uniref:Helix-turn-helix domain-containing protein n=1 Tax=Solirubrobacter phytolaccae TaxID=1404360 RepID=A0A9X3N422_9ACTN|nr:helix-turn-helix domain-containing protein [Solirubrobacter phytolaccae]MDA0179086.1 helix-turn-helix domain-containing protein [Solirubrobacter phytolaccae]
MATLSPPSADALRATLPDLADDIIAAIVSEVPDYARAMEGRFGEVVRFGVTIALSRFVDVLSGAKPKSDSQARDTYVRLGAGEYRAGRSLDALLAAYRVGAKVAWRRFVDAGTNAGFEPDTLYDLGAGMFAYIDEISAESAAGFAEAQSDAAGESQRRRRALVRLLVQEPPAAEETVRTAAQAAGWTLPRLLAAVVAGESAEPERTDELDGIAARLARRLGPGAVGAAVGGIAIVLLPDPEGPGRRRALESALSGDLAALGPAVVWPEAATSLRRASAAFRLAEQGRLGECGGGGDPSSTGQSSASPGGGSSANLVVAVEHLPALLLAAEPALAADLARSRLAPLDALAAGPRERLVETLRAWLDRPGQVQAVAAALEVHPQTVRYRLKQLRELFGERLDDPEARFELALALRAADGVRYT